MLTHIKKHLNSEFAFLNNKRLLLTVSGGIDSVVLVYLLKELGYNIGIAHCNFQLRDFESEGDNQFVKELAKTLQISFFEIRFDTEKYANSEKLSIQMAARKLRYDWFETLATQENFDYILTAHHADDNLETVLINLTRGTGLDGLLGIPKISGKIVRPLLPFSREQIVAYAQKNQIAWREDSSNASTKYLRNKIRHTVIPVLKELNPMLLQSFQNTVSHLQESQDIVSNTISELKKEIFEEKSNCIKIDLEKIKQLPNPKAYLYPLLQPYGFTSWDDIYNLMDAVSGKQIFSDSYHIIKDRNCFLIQALAKENSNKSYVITTPNALLLTPIRLQFLYADKVGEASKKTIYVDAEQIKFPLEIRKWQEGDVFYPMGMMGQKKKVSKFFKDEKMSLFEKEAAWLLCSGEKIVWIIGCRPDERFKVQQSTTTILNITWHDD